MSNGEFPHIIHNPACTKAVSLVFTLLLCLYNEHLSIDKKDDSVNLPAEIKG